MVQISVGGLPLPGQLSIVSHQAYGDEAAPPLYVRKGSTFQTGIHIIEHIAAMPPGAKPQRNSEG
ncbi:MAG: hypothetical protein ABIZ95_11275, partial [Pyrinomonadaceae bacterium]